jgi:hypothetical protein
MAEAAFTGAVGDVEDDVVGPRLVADTPPTPSVIEAEIRAHAPCDVVVGA